jgi:hypothetical protein
MCPYTAPPDIFVVAAGGLRMNAVDAPELKDTATDI